MRRLLTIVSVMAVFMAMVAVPASADDPIEFMDQAVFDALSPCTGEMHTVTINFLISIHEHEDEFNVRVRRTGYTSDGYVMKWGKETFVGSDGTEYGQFRDPWINPATGDKFRAEARFLAVDGEVLMDDFRLVCLTG